MKKSIKIQIKHRWLGSILFEYEKEDNTVKDTLIEAVKQRAYLQGAYLRGADLQGAYLQGAYLQGAYLRGADLQGAYLRGADLQGAYLQDAYLQGADLRGADLQGAYLRGADLQGAYLQDAYLQGADLQGADLQGADLRGADLRGADLQDAYLQGAKNIPFVPLSCPSDGAFIGWKKVAGKLVKLEIPEDAKRSSSTSRKCRSDKAKVLAITNLDGTNPIDEILNEQTLNLLYKVGEVVFPDSFDENRWNECSHGIHFFINKQDAINY